MHVTTHGHRNIRAIEHTSSHARCVYVLAVYLVTFVTCSFVAMQRLIHVTLEPKWMANDEKTGGVL